MFLRKGLLFFAILGLLICTGKAVADTAPSPDFDGDGVVGFPDFLLFVEQFGFSREDEAYQARFDLDGDGMIGFSDFLIFVDNFGKEVPPSGDAEMVSIPDMNLRAVIEDSLGKASGAPITKDEMTTLTRLEAPNSHISDLTGLEFATRLKILNFGNEGGQNSNSIMDISALSGLNSLTYLNLNQNSIVDISPLSGLTSLTELGLSINPIVDISPLSGLTSLTELGLLQNSIVDISPLSGLTNLTLLGLGNPFTGLPFVSNNNSITDISPLSGMTSLTALFLSNNSITDISPLSGMTSLTELDLSNNSISDLAPLVANTGLGSGDRVDVRTNPLSDASINTHIPALQGRGVRVQF